MPTLSDYHPDSIGQQWLKELMPAKVSIIIPSYKDEKYLKLCIESIKACTIIPHRIIVVNAENPRRYFAKAVNDGVAQSNSEYIVIMNSDIIVSKGWLEPLLTDGIAGPLSNCDYGWLHNYKINIKGIDLLPGTNTLEQIMPIIPDIYEFRSPYKEIHERDWHAAYCWVMKRSVWNAVGKMDENFKNSGEDVDFCYRAKKLGYKITQNFSSFVFHFGAISRKVEDTENHDKYQAEQKEVQPYLQSKYNKETVVIYTGMSWERWNWQSIDNGGIGGSESWAIYLAEELAKDYRVILFADCPYNETHNGVQWLHFNHYPDWIKWNFADYFISSRTVDTFNHQIRAKKKYVMLHDIWLSNQQIDCKVDQVDKFLCLSDWHRDFVHAHHGIPKEKIALTCNGIDFKRFDQPVVRQGYRLIYSSSPDRGLDTLLYLFDFLKKELPKLELHIYYGFNNWKKAIQMRNNADELKKMNELKAAMNKPGVFNHGRIGQKELAAEFLKSDLWAYPTDFEETFCITAIECQAAGIPILSSNYAGLRTTVSNSGILLGNGQKGQSYTKEYRIKFTEECMKLLTIPAYWKEWSDKGKQNALKYSWQNCALKWKGLFHE